MALRCDAVSASGEKGAMSSCRDRGVNVSLSGTIDRESRSVSISLANRHDRVVWVPREEMPAYEVDDEGKLVVLSYGYHDDVYGEYKGRYMVPPLQGLESGGTLSWEVTEPELLEAVLPGDVATVARVRIALKEIATSNVRGEQPVDEYLDASCVVESPRFEKRSR